MAQKYPKNIVIVGGSLGGLFTGLALKRLQRNLNIRIFERNPTPLLHDQGAGVVAGQDTQTFFQKYDRTQTPLTVTSSQRLYLDRSGATNHREGSVQQMTSWDLMYHLLRVNFDGVDSGYAKPPQTTEGEGSALYEYGCTVTGIKAPTTIPEASTLDLLDPVEITVQRSSGEVFSVHADMVIAADGPSSTIRSLYFPDVKRKYVGYVAWRGTVPESAISESSAAAFAEKFAFYHTTGTQLLAYLIPGRHGSKKPGDRLVNWVWYNNYAENSPEHIELMTDRSGKRHRVTLPPGGIQEDVWTRQKARAREILPPQFAELVEETEVPFVQAITDAIAPSAVLADGRVLLLGDALANFRPHTAASTAQAAMNAMTLAEAIENVIDIGSSEPLNKWERHVVQFAKEVQRFGVQIGNKSQFDRQLPRR
jgi:2-polyprenyl-6-methoxyphenol hydroxylase-like FAD-dependent oxidoreductase